MTKVFVATPPDLHPISPHREYSMAPEVRAAMLLEPEIERPKDFIVSEGKGRYVPDGGYEFDLELNLLDTASKLPIRGVDIVSGEFKGFTDKIGRVLLRLPRGNNEILLTGKGFLEKGNFAPEATSFEPILLKVDLDSDSTFTIYSTGQVVPGERKALDNPGHHSIGNSFDLESFLKQHGVALGLIGVAGVTMYFLGKSKNATK